MNTKQALSIRDAIFTLSKALNMEFLEVARNVCFLDKSKGDILRQASALWSAFDDAGIVERGAILGMEITVSNDETNAEIGAAKLSD